MRIGINGFGRIGRNFTKAVLERQPQIEIAAINDLMGPQECAHLLKYDSNYGIYEGDVTAEDGAITIDGRRILVLAERDPAKLPWKDLGVEVVVESTGLFTDAAKALYLTIPQVEGSFDGFALRVPTPTVSLIYLVAQTKKATTKEELNAILRGASQGELSRYVAYTEEELVSSDFKKNPYSSIIDSKLTNANGDLVQIAAWYDNEWGYSCRLAELTAMILEKIPATI